LEPVGAEVTRSKLSHIALLTAVNLVAFAAIAIGCELILGNWFLPYAPPEAAIVDQDDTFRQDLYDPAGLIRYVRDKYGLRGVHEPLDRVEVVTVGGSTTDQRYVGEGQTWQDAWRTAGDVPVANAGVDGMSSFGHIVAVTEWLHKIPGLKPQYYVHYIGVNDASASGDRGKPAELFEQVTSWRHKLVRRSVLARAMAKLWLRASGPREVAHQRMDVPRMLPLDEMKSATLETNDIERYVEQFYKPNLRRLLELNAGRGERVIFVSQPANPAFVRWSGGQTFLTPSKPDLARWAVALGMINRTNRDVCAESVGCQFVDLAGKVRFAPEDFYDLVHNTPSGARKIGEFLAQQVPIAKHGALGAAH
jgi:hypothetical protein